MDIIEWLRTYGTVPSRLNEAADEIERLREALINIRDFGPMTVDDQRWRIANTALKETE